MKHVRDYIAVRLESLSAIFRSEFVAQQTSKAPTIPLQPGLAPLELAKLIRARYYADRQWARDRRSVWSARSSLLQAFMFLLSLLAIVFLGIATLDGFAIAGFICTAAATAVAALESFFNWRSRWIAADAALAQWHDLEETLSLYVASRTEQDLDVDFLLQFDEQRRSVWTELNQIWLAERKGPGPAGSSAP